MDVTKEYWIKKKYNDGTMLVEFLAGGWSVMTLSEFDVFVRKEECKRCINDIKYFFDNYCKVGNKDIL